MNNGVTVIIEYTGAVPLLNITNDGMLLPVHSGQVPIDGLELTQ